MKKLILLFIFLTIGVKAQDDSSDEQLDHKLDSLNIDYSVSTKKFIDAKKNVTDLFNIFIYNGDYEIKAIENTLLKLHAVQDIVKFPPDFNNEARAYELRDVFSKGMDLMIRSEKNKLLAAKYYEIYDENITRDTEKVLIFLRESNFPPSKFKLLSKDERIKLLEEFEKKKDKIQK